MRFARSLNLTATEALRGKAFDMQTIRMGFIGAGQMATALAQGVVRANLVKAQTIWAADVQSAAREQFARNVPGVQLAGSNREVAELADVLFLAVKPQHVAAAAAELHPLAPHKLVISIAAGIRLRDLYASLGTERIVRVMPNTPCLVGRGASAYALGAAASAEDGALVQQLLGAVGYACPVEENLLDAVTGLSGSGPAFVYLMIEALSDGGVRTGLPRNVATALAAETVRGAAEMVLSTQQHPAVLKDRVASPGGTTIAGLQILETSAVRGAFMKAVEAAAARSRELGQS